MIKRNQKGFAGLLIAVIFLVLLLLGSIGFGVWAFTGRSDYKNNVDQKITEALAVAEESQRTKIQAEFAEKEKSPFKVYQSSPTFGTISFSYPKTWSAYVDQSTNSSNTPLKAYFYPGIVPGVLSGTAFALHIEVVQSSYDTVLKQYDSLIKKGTIKASATVPPLMKGLANVQPGTRLKGEIVPKKDGSMVIIKIRDKVLKIYTESNEFLHDFDETILSTLTFTP